MVSRARSFGAVAAAYAEHRPGYAPDAVAWALAGRSGDVLDLGAGTGALTRQLLARPGLRVTAVEPDPAMLAELWTRVPGIDARLGSAEAIPLPDAAVDAVLVGQALHWFDLDQALPEIVRVLRPGGVLAALWNAGDDEVEWVAGYHTAAFGDREVLSVASGADRPDLQVWPGLGTCARAEFHHVQRRTIDGLIATLGTHSWSLVAQPAERDAALAAVRAYLEGRPETSAGEFELPLVTTVLRAGRD